MKTFYAQLNDTSSMKREADKMEIVNESIRVYCNGEPGNPCRVNAAGRPSSVCFSDLCQLHYKNGFAEKEALRWQLKSG